MGLLKKNLIFCRIITVYLSLITLPLVTAADPSELQDPSRIVKVPAYAVTDRELLWKGKNHPDHCNSTKEFVDSLEFMRNQKEVNIAELPARDFASDISKGCDGAAQRFANTFLLMKKSGVDHNKSIQVGLLFSHESDATTKNFFEIFQQTYLGELFDLDYRTALEVSYELSRDFEGNKDRAREDYLGLAKKCMDKKELNLSIKYCAVLALKFARLSKYFPDGVLKPFNDLYTLLREDKRFGLNIKSALEVILQVLPYGPKGPENFISGFEYAIKGTGLSISGKNALSFAILMAKRSVKTMPPPIFHEK